MKLAPVIWCALGAALAYYGLAGLFSAGLPPALILFLLLPVAAAVLALRFCRSRVFLKQKGRRRRFYALLCAFFYTAGIMCGILARRGAEYKAQIFPGIPVERVTGVSGILRDDPRASRNGQGMAALQLERAYGKAGVRVSARGALTVMFPEETLPRLKDFGRGSRVTIDGTFIEPQKPGQNIFFRAKSVHIARAPGPVNRLRTTIRLALLDFFNHTWGGLSMALLLGIRDNLDSGLALQYTKSGCAYILALSGMHLAIISSVIAFLLKKPLGLKGAAIAGTCFIMLYVYLVGAQPSLCRAAIMYALGAAAVIFALPVTPFLLLSFSFIFQLVVFPASGDSLSFILSYLALAGILAGTEYIAGIFRGWIPAFILSPLAASLSAFLATMAVSALFFGELRLIGIVAGLAMVPLTTFFMIGSMAYLVLGFIPVIKTLAALPLNWLYLILERLSFFAAKAPPLAFPPAPWALAFAVCFPLLLTGAGMWKTRRAALLTFSYKIG